MHHHRDVDQTGDGSRSLVPFLEVTYRSILQRTEKRWSWWKLLFFGVGH